MKGNTDNTMLALAYGKKGTDFKIDDGKIVMIGNSRPHTLNDLNGGCVQELPITSLITIEKTDGITNFLLYGVKDLHYTWNEATHDLDGDKIMDANEIEWLQKQFEFDHKTGLVYNEYGDMIPVYELDAFRNAATKDDLINATPETIEDLLVGTHIVNMEGTPIYTVTKIDITEIGEDIDGNPIHAHICYVENADGTEAKYTEHTISDLSSRTEHNALMVDITKVLTIGDIMGGSNETSNIMEALKDWKIKDLSDQAKINGLTLGNILNIQDDSSKIMLALKDKTLGDLTKQETINELKFKDILDIKEDSSKIMIALQDKTISDLTDQKTINDLKLKDILDIKEDSSKIMIALQDKTISDLTDQDTIKNLKLDQILDIKDDSSKIMIALKDKSISDLTKQETINDLQLKDILDLENSNSKLMEALKEKKISDLTKQETINELELGQILNID
jgi:hypothetical protein